MSLPTPRRVLVVAFSLTQQWFSRVLHNSRIIKTLPHVFLFWRMMRMMRDELAPRTPVVIFWWRAHQSLRAMEHPVYHKNIAKANLVVTGRDILEEAKKTGRPIFFVAWHHGAQYLERALFDVDDEVISPSAGHFYHPRLINFDETKVAPVLLRLAKELESGGRVLMAFDAQFGKLEIPVLQFGFPWKVAQGYPELVKRYQPIVISVTQYLLEDHNIEIRLGGPLLTDEKIEAISKEDIIKKTAEHLLSDLKNTDPYQVDYRWFFDQLIAK